MAAIEIQERAMEYGLRAIQLYRRLKTNRDEVGLILGKQYLRSATSIGANLVEAEAGESRRDFVHKCCVSQKEARESKYWLVLLQKSKTVPEKRLSLLLDETDQLIAILTRIVLNSKRNKI